MHIILGKDLREKIWLISYKINWKKETSSLTSLKQIHLKKSQRIIWVCSLATAHMINSVTALKSLTAIASTLYLYITDNSMPWKPQKVSTFQITWLTLWLTPKTTKTFITTLVRTSQTDSTPVRLLLSPKWSTARLPKSVSSRALLEAVKHIPSEA